MRVERERNSNTVMPPAAAAAAGGRRIGYINAQTASLQQHQIRGSSVVTWFLQRPHSIPLVLAVFLFLAWLSLRLQRVAYAPPHSFQTDIRANLARFDASEVAKDNRGWIFDPIALARASGISGGAVSCASLHVGEIRPGKIRANHRHHDSNETFLIWGAATKFRMENNDEDDGYAEVILGRDEIAVAASPVHKAHALVNIDSIRSIFFIGCQDNVVSYNASSTDFNVWKDL
ncbi:uncharacterized protein LOC114398933 [Glycine soja]|uniref:Cupin type-1 domain-containing protein n=1 Tax=Glycine soja TaxID=3848 RepID=A0A445FFG0_GLYSO|nr:uncharacterized protein LOC114398933 [Glycine soja]RZB47586.1 hypothetical protein D0Y65_051263 [Glycine soja]